MKEIAAFLLLISFTFLPNMLLGQQNPFKSDSSPKKELKSSGSELSLIQKTMQTITDLQRNIRVYMTKMSKRINENPFGFSFWAFLLAAFAYGVVHALGPGHGKSVVCSYFLSRPGKILHGAIMGHLITFIHVGSATVAISCLYFIMHDSSMHSIHKLSSKLGLVSYSLILLIGLFLVARVFYEFFTGKWQGMKNNEQQPYSNLKGLVGLSVATGIMPCPGAAIILTFALTIGIVLPGYLSMLAIALGMGLTTTCFALTAVGTRSSLLKLSEKKMKLFALSYYTLSFAGALFVLAFGIVMLVGTWT